MSILFSRGVPCQAIFDAGCRIPVYFELQIDALANRRIPQKLLESKTWFGYSFTATKTGNGDSIQLSIGTVRDDKGPAGFNQVPMPKYYPGPFTLAPGDILRMPLLINRDTGQTLVDELQIFTHSVTTEEAIGPTLRAGTARDFSLQDVEMRLIGGSLLVNGKVEERMGGGLGAVVWYSKKGLGPTILSFAPQPDPRFRKAGVIQGRTLRFQIGSNQYEWRCPEPILPGGPYNLYVYWDPGAKYQDAAFGAAKTGEIALKTIALMGVQQAHLYL